MQRNDSILQQIASIGDRMIEAGRAGDIETLSTLAAQRGTLVAELNAYSHPSEVDPNWKALAEGIDSQYKLLWQTIAELERRISSDLQDVQRFTSARKSYSPTRKPDGILHGDVRG